MTIRVTRNEMLAFKWCLLLAREPPLCNCLCWRGVLLQKAACLRSMSLVATLSTSGCTANHLRAIASVLPWVDLLVTVDSGLSGSELANIRNQVGDKFRLIEVADPENLVATRMLLLEFAAELGGTWALILNGDEELHFPGHESSGALLAALNDNVSVPSWAVPYQGSQYARERFIRLPTCILGAARTHDCFGKVGTAELSVLPGAYFVETPKSRAGIASKIAREQCNLEKQLANDAQNATHWMSLGNTLEAQQDTPGAVNAYLNGARRSENEKDAAWAFYRAASGLYRLQDFPSALALCASGRGQHNIPELSWLAGHCYLRLHRYSEALEACRQAVHDAETLHNERSGKQCKFLPAWFEAPHELMRLLFQILEMPTRARLAHQAYLTARSERLQPLPANCVTDAAGLRRVLIDLGTHYGEGLRQLARQIPLDPTWEIHTFEPNPACQSERKLAGFHLPINFHQAAAWVHDGEAEFVQEEPRISRSGSPSDGGPQADGWASCLCGIRTLGPGLSKRTKVTTIDLAAYLKTFDPVAEITVKMDIEGAEFAVLRHLIKSQTISRIRRLFIEWHDRFATGETPESRVALQRAIESHGVEVVMWD